MLELNEEMRASSEFVDSDMKEKHLLSASLFQERRAVSTSLAPAYQYYIKDVCTSSGLTINDFYFDGTFPDSPSTRFFKHFGFDLFHGWVPNLGHPVESLLLRFPRLSEDLVRNLVALEADGGGLPAGILSHELACLNDFASREPPDGMTARGLEVTLERMAEGGLAVFYSQRQCVCVCVCVCVWQGVLFFALT